MLPRTQSSFNNYLSILVLRKEMKTYFLSLISSTDRRCGSSWPAPLPIEVTRDTCSIRGASVSTKFSQTATASRYVLVTTASRVHSMRAMEPAKKDYVLHNRINVATGNRRLTYYKVFIFRRHAKRKKHYYEKKRKERRISHRLRIFSTGLSSTWPAPLSTEVTRGTCPARRPA